MIKKIKSDRHLFIVLFCIFVFMLILNSMSPLVHDDYSYFVKTSSIKTILSDEYQQYMTWTGRSVVHVIFRFFTKLPKIYFNIYNSCMFSILVYQIIMFSSIIKDRATKNVYLKGFIIFSLMWIFTPAFNNVYLWMAGSVNYLTAMVIMLSFILFYHRYITESKEQNNSFFKTIGMLLLGIIAGWCNENTSGGTLFIVVAYTALSYFYKNKKIEKWMIAGIVGNIVGFLFMVMAPGNDIRATYFDRSNLSIFWKILDAIPAISRALQENAMFPLTIALALIVLSYLNSSLTISNILSSLFFVGGILTIGVLTISPTALSWSRSYFGGIIFIFISIVISLFELLTNFDKINKVVFSMIFGYLMISFLLLFFNGTADIYKNYVSYNNQNESIKRQIKNGEMDIVVPPLNYKPQTIYPVYNGNDITSDKNNERNRSVAAYWGVDSIRVEEKEK
ncbi:DUF3329 domain-containing protein [Enterococcus faecium]|uniref:DUF3329 domain-containing protein n=1 Tax=Enterococcus faecium TaxID=1352 RepID=UPI00115AC014|nr:DUF6056 family protein [Enterococcus faecium]